MVHTPSTRLNDPLWCSHGSSAGVLKPLEPQAGASLGAPLRELQTRSNPVKAAHLLTDGHLPPLALCRH